MPDNIAPLRYLALVTLFAAVGMFATLANQTLARDHVHVPQVAAVIEALPQENTELPLVAKAAYVIDLATNETVFAYNATAQLPLASLTKLMLIVLADRHITDTTLTISSQALLPEGDWGLTVGDSWNTHDLVDFTLMTSSNDGAAALAEAIEKTTGQPIADTLNELASELGMSQSYFVNETGLDEGTTFSGNYGSAQDIARVLAYIYTHHATTAAATAVSDASFTSAQGLVYEANNTNVLVDSLPGLVFGKTGFTDLAGGNLSVVVETEPAHPYAVVVLGSTFDARFTDVTTLVRFLSGVY